MPARRSLAWALAFASLAGVGLVLLLAPPIRDYESFGCHGGGAAFLREHPKTWVAVRAPQKGGASLSYDAATGTTTVRPGCGHGLGADAFRVQGDLRDEPASWKLLLRPAGGAPWAPQVQQPTPTGPPSTTHPPAQVAPSLYVPASLAPRLVLFWAPLAGLALGLVLLLTPVPTTRSWVPPAGLLLGAALAGRFLADGSSVRLLVSLLCVPLAFLALAGFGIGAFVARRRAARMAILLALALAALGFLVHWFAFLDAFPTQPLA
ncbi:MAG TPA: hypothetical protein VHI93_02785 [Candidatus Thermoplasmatota archaeon]|nr:hypothetical protein [Candidatus Thermoplasmatota archaeon]